MTSAGIPKLADFGLSRTLSDSPTALETSSFGELKGTTRWMAYELLQFLDGYGAEVICTKASDVWAFGMTIYVSN